jgi:guanylate kinase
MPGSLIVISAPSGAGKTSLVHALLEHDPQIGLSVSFTTRQPREGEINGKHYHFIGRDTFLEMAKHGEFLESAEVYGNFYGTSQKWITEETAKGRDILLEIDWQGAAQVRKIFPGCVSIFILPPSLEALSQRLNGRGTDDPTVISRRLAAVRDDVAHVAEFDYVIINEDLNRALHELESVVLAARLRGSKQIARHQHLINQLQTPEN